MLNRRGLITGLVSFIAAPAIVRAASLMPVKAIVLDELPLYGFSPGMETLVYLRELDRITKALLPELGAFGTAVLRMDAQGRCTHIPLSDMMSRLVAAEPQE